MDAKQLLMAMLRSVACERSLDVDSREACTPEMLEQVYQLAAHHDLAHFVGQAVSKLELPDSDILKKCKQAAMIAFYRYARINYEYESICKLLEAEQIPFIPLKGSVLRAFYPEPWMRTSCDIDILVHEDILESAADVLVTKLGYARKEKGDHDISMYSASGVHLELHYAAVDEGRLPEAQAVLAGIWEDAVPACGMVYHRCMSDEMFYFYHIAHMAKHFENGGCGIRPFLDLWILRHRMEHHAQQREKLLAQGGMLTFARAAEKLSEVWFSGMETDPLSQKLECFVIEGGVYGNIKGLVTVRQTQSGSKLKYALSKIFLPYNTLKYQYPVLQKHRWLTPVFEVVRWCKLIFKGGMGRSIRELKTNAGLSAEEISSTAELIKYLGL